MADTNNKRAVNGQENAAAPATGPPPAHGIKFGDSLRGLRDQLQELLESTGDVQEYGVLLEAKESLQNELQGLQLEISRLGEEKGDSKKTHAAETREMQRRIEQLEAHTSWLQDDYGRKYTVWSESSKSHEAMSRELSEAQAKLRDSQKAEAAARSESHTLRKDYTRQEKDLGDALRHCASYKKKLEIRKLEAEELSRKVEEATAERQDAVERLGVLPLDLESMSRNFGLLAAKIQQLAEVVGNELPDPDVTIGLPANFPIKVPGSNSPAARSMRRAVAETTVVEELRRSVFLDIPNDHVHLDGVGRTLEWLEENNCQEESNVIRCQLARALARGAPAGPVQARNMASGVVDTLAPWITNESTRDEFHDGLAGVFKEAIELWRRIQQAETRVTPIFDLTLHNWNDENRREEFDGTAPSGQAHGRKLGSPANFGAPVAVLFPHIVTAKSKIFSGSALFQNQSLVMEAYRELQSQQASSGGGMRPRRRLSTRDPPSPRNRRVSSSSVGEARLRLGISRRGE